ncbi:SRPBCC family protein [Chitinophaga sp. 30R24]|uniref:SRPBCC family protein n=1 Tax=Chitinophaga sp. 30R24 TaxID=3248838 RepID=UPI003B8F3A82
MKKVLKFILYIIILLIIIIASLEIFSSYKPAIGINQNAPVKTTQSIRINAPVATVYNIFTDVDNWPSWQKEISAAKINGQLQVGATIDWKTGGLTIHSTLKTVVPDSVVGWSGKAFGAFANHVWQFEQHEGYTIVTVNESMEGWLVSLLKGYFQSHLELATKNWLEYLKAQSEKQH